MELESARSAEPTVGDSRSLLFLVNSSVSAYDAVTQQPRANYFSEWSMVLQIDWAGVSSSRYRMVFSREIGLSCHGVRM